MNLEQLAELKRAALAASPGPWTPWPFDRDQDYYALVVNADRRQVCCIPPGANVHGCPGVLDQVYIALANPATVLAMIAEIERLTAS